MIDVSRIEHADALVVLSAADRAELARHLLPLSYRSGQSVISQGRKSPAAYLHLGGTLIVRRTLPGNDTALQGAIGTGEWFGVLSALDGHPATASVVAMTDCEVAALGMADLDDFLFRSGIGARLLRGWLRSLGHQLGRVNRGNEQMLALAATLRTPHDP
ncbi:MAG: cyclic nucleotide-binding domain-containing protein [Proteobacteria bacterium]|nr:cyclic nucleotide-binding domain-containing protein [Pseudomonadota bacterium]MCP4917540.1 cyclic nucleotide-binding domain-containing protein [Pseudomonadota bacterium]